jgi:hypothetical protein
MKLPRILLVVFLTLLLLCSSAYGQKDTYINSQGHRVHRPVKVKGKHAPVGATAQCRDGSYSFSQNHRGTCSHHGGVARWLD